ncbi:MAG TPA: nuclear transport factor 2 family protein [Terriglobales bacterium]|nr:nuclear transport factor 2 family protein [Terriglobales bacterium]
MKKIVILVAMLMLTLTLVAQNNAADAKLQSELFAKEKALWDAFFKKDLQPFTTLLADDGVFADSMGFTNKADMLKAITGINCKINSYSFSKQKMSRIDQDAVILTFTATQEGECDGQKVPVTSYVTSTWVKRKGKWLGFSHTETPAMVMEPAKK